MSEPKKIDDDEAQWLIDLSAATTRLVDDIEAALLFHSEVFMKRIRSFHPATLTIDGEALNVHIKRMSINDVVAFENTLEEFGFSTDGQFAVPDGLDKNKVVEWVISVISDNVSVPSGQLEIEDNDGTVREVLNGRDLLQCYGGRGDVMPQLLAHVYGENKLPEAAKPKFRIAADKLLVVGGEKTRPRPLSRKDVPTPPATPDAEEPALFANG